MLRMNCPKCGFAWEGRGADCPACGIVFAKFKPNPQQATPPASSATPMLSRDEPAFEPDRLDTVDAKRFDKQPVLSMLIGSALALWALNSPFLYTLSNMMKTLVHELGHTFSGWGFGIPSVPAFDFSYGGGVTIHQDPSLFVLSVIYAGLAYLLFLYRRNPRSLVLICMIGGAHIASMASGLDESITIAMGHGFELLFAGIFFYRALSGFACVHGAERPLYGFLGFLITFDNMRFVYRLIYSHEHRWRIGD